MIGREISTDGIEEVVGIAIHDDDGEFCVMSMIRLPFPVAKDSPVTEP